jgi:drug/metabolite transporter, DME family
MLFRKKRFARLAQRYRPLYIKDLMANTERNLARLQALAAAVLFSTGGAGIKVEAFNAAQVSMVRSGIAAIALLLWLRGRIRWTPGMLVAGVVYAATLTFFVGATKLTTAANAIFLQAAAPIYLLVLAPFVLDEHIRRRDVVYLAVVGAGMISCFIARPEPSVTAPNPVVGNWLGAASGLAWALTLLTLRKIGRADEDGNATVASVVAGNVFASVGAAVFALPLPAAPATEWVTLVYLGVFQIGVAYVCLSSAIRHLPALEISLLLLLEPALNPVWTWAMRGESPGIWTLVGGAVIVGASGVKVLMDRPVPFREAWRDRARWPRHSSR